jgi:hypothetical protein
MYLKRLHYLTTMPIALTVIKPAPAIASTAGAVSGKKLIQCKYKELCN